MYRYVLIAAFAALLVWFGSVAEKRVANEGLKRTCMIVCNILAVLIFCVAAGVRDVQVGTDVNMYVVPCFDAAQQMGFWEFMTQGEYARWMPFSKLLFWAVPNTTHSLFGLLFAIHAVIVIPLFIALKGILREKAWIGVLVFGIAFFPISLNIMRQFMGMGFVLLSYLFVRKRRLLIFLMFIVIGALFHETCFLGLLIYPIWLVASGSLKRIDVQPAVFGVASLAVIQIFYPAFKLVDVLFGRYGFYLRPRTSFVWGEGADEFCFLVVICVALGVLYYLQKDKKKPGAPNELSGVAAIVFFGIAAFSTCFFLFQLFRVGMFFLYFAVLLIPLAYENIRARKSQLEFVVVSISLLMLFGQIYYGTGAHEVIPYVVGLSG